MAQARYTINYVRKLKADAFTFTRTEPRSEQAKTTDELNLYISLINEDESIIRAEYVDNANNKVTKIK